MFSTLILLYLPAVKRKGNHGLPPVTLAATAVALVATAHLFTAYETNIQLPVLVVVVIWNEKLRYVVSPTEHHHQVTPLFVNEENMYTPA